MEPPGYEGADSRQPPLPEPAAQVIREEAGCRVPWPLSPSPGGGPCHPGRWGGMGGPSRRRAAVPPGEPSTSLRRCGPAQGRRERETLSQLGGPDPNPWSLDLPALEAPGPPLGVHISPFLQGLPSHLLLPQTTSSCLRHFPSSSGLAYSSLSLLILEFWQQKTLLDPLVPFTSSGTDSYLCADTHVLARVHRSGGYANARVYKHI